MVMQSPCHWQCECIVRQGWGSRDLAWSCLSSSVAIDATEITSEYVRDLKGPARAGRNDARCLAPAVDEPGWLSLKFYALRQRQWLLEVLSWRTLKVRQAEHQEASDDPQQNTQPAHVRHRLW